MAKNTDTTETQEEKLARVTANYLKILASPDHGESHASRYLETEKMNNTRFHNSLKKQAQKKDNEDFWGSVAKGAGNVAEAFTSSMTAGQSIYLQAGVDMLASQFGEDEGMSYTEALKNARNRQHQFRQENPGTAMIADVAGGVVPGSAAANLAMKSGAMTIKAGQPLANTLSQAKVDVPVAAVEEFSRAVSEGADVKDATIRGGIGATFGGVGSAISGTLEKISSPVTNWVSDTWNGIWGNPKTTRLTPTEKSTSDTINQNLEDEGLTRQDMIERADEAEELGIGDVSLAQVAGPESQSTVKNLGITPGGTKTKIKTELIDDLESSSEEVAETLRKGMGFADEGDKSIKLRIENTARAKAKPLYDLANRLPNISNKELDNLIRDIDEAIPGDFFNKVVKNIKLRNAKVKTRVKGRIPIPKEMPYGDFSIGMLDTIQRSIRDLALKADPSDAAELWKLRTRMLGLVDTQTKKSFNQLMRKGFDRKKGVIHEELYAWWPQLKGLPKEKQIEIMSPLFKKKGFYVSPFTQARKEWGGTLSNLDAYTKGTTALRPSKNASAVKDDWDELATQAEKDMYRLSAATHAIEGIEGGTAETKNFAKIFLSEGQRKKFEIMFENNPELVENFIRRLEIQNEAHKSKSGMMPRSDTAENTLNFFSHLREWMSTSSIENKALQATGRVVQKITNEGLLKQKNQALADAYMQKGAPAIRKTMQTAKKRDSDLANRAMNQAKIGGGFSTGASGLLKPSQSQNKEDEWTPDKELSSGNY